MGIREKHLEAKKEKNDLRKSIKKLKEKVKKHERKIAKKEAKIESINLKLKKFKKKLREREEEKRKASAKKNKAAVKKGKSIVPATNKGLRKVPKTRKDLASTPDKSLRKVDVKKNEASPYKAEKEDLTLIEGIGEKISSVLNERGIHNYLQLANCSSDTLDVILKESFSNYRVFSTLTWPEQALLAHNGQWEELKILQDKLTGGR